MREPPTVEALRSRFSAFGTYDYAAFSGMLIASALFGIHCAFRRKTTAEDAVEYLLGGKTMSVFPVATSLITSSLSGIVLLAIPVETYLYGTEYAFVCIAIILSGFISSCLVLPVFHEMQLISAYGYLEVRFDRNVRLFGSLMFMVYQTCWLPFVVYLPALALNQVTGINIHVVTPSVCLLCILYTSLGGLKTVVWANVVPIWCMIGSLIMVSVKGSFDAGGFGEVWQRNYEGGRIVVPTFEADLTIRHTFWGICFGSLITHIQGSFLNQNVLQRYLSLSSLSRARRFPRRSNLKKNITYLVVTPASLNYTYWSTFRTTLLAAVIVSTEKENMKNKTRLGNRSMVEMSERVEVLTMTAANKVVRNVDQALWTVVFVTSALVLVCCYSGLVIYSLYRDCDPLTTQLARSKDQLLPLFMMKTVGHLPGLPGLFVAGIFSASLSSLSMGLSSSSAVVLQDFIKPFLNKELGARATCLILRAIAVIFGILFLFLLFIMDKLGTVLQLLITLGSMTSGPAFAIFFSGLFLPWVNAKGALLGGLLGLFTSGLVIVGAENAVAGHKVRFSPKPISVEGCVYYYNATFLGSALENSNEGSVAFPLFKLSYLWYTAFGGVTTVILALIISAASGFSDPNNLNPKCFSPAVRRWLPASKSTKSKYKFPLKEIK